MSYFTELADALRDMDPAPLLPFVRACEGTLWIAGNGGSAAVAQHWACDLGKAAGRRVQALGCNSAVLTAWANDDSYRAALVAELDRLVRDGDALICISCSGESSNIVGLLWKAHDIDMPAALVTKAGSPRGKQVDVLVEVPATDYGILEDCFSAIGHWLTKELA